MADSDTSPCGEREDYGFVSTSSNSLFYFLCFGGDGAVNGAEGPLELSWRVPAILRSSIVDTKTKRGCSLLPFSFFWTSLLAVSRYLGLHFSVGFCLLLRVRNTLVV